MTGPFDDALDAGEIAPAENQAAYRRRASIRKQAALDAISREFDKAIEKHRGMAGPHEGYAVILEELDELWAEVRAQQHDRAAMAKEAAQVGAMAIRFLVDVCE